MYLASLVHSMAFVENQLTSWTRGFNGGVTWRQGSCPHNFAKPLNILYLYIQKLQIGIWYQSNLKLCIYSSTNKYIFLKRLISSYNYNFVNIILLKKKIHLKVFFEKSIVELHYFLILDMLVKYQNYQRSITISSIKYKNFKCFKL